MSQGTDVRKQTLFLRRHLGAVRGRLSEAQADAYTELRVFEEASTGSDAINESDRGAWRSETACAPMEYGRKESPCPNLTRARR